MKPLLKQKLGRRGELALINGRDKKGPGLRSVDLVQKELAQVEIVRLETTRAQAIRVLNVVEIDRVEDPRVLEMEGVGDRAVLARLHSTIRLQL